jgi:hypothetical protein
MRMAITRLTAWRWEIFGICPKARQTLFKVINDASCCNETLLIRKLGLETENEYLLVFDDGKA